MRQSVITKNEIESYDLHTSQQCRHGIF